MILDSVSTDLIRELKLRDSCSNAEKMLEVLDNIQSNELRVPDLMVKIFLLQRDWMENL